VFAHLHKPQFDGLVATLMGGDGGFVPLIELGVHPLIKEALLGRPILSVRDDIEFMRSMGYDFIKIQPAFSLELNQTLVESVAVSGAYKNSPDRAWAPEQKGLITSWEEFWSYRWPTVDQIIYSRFDEARTLLPGGMGIIGQYGDIFTNAWELMGFETFATSIYEQPDLVKAVFDKVSELILSMFDIMAGMDEVGALWYSDDIAYTGGLMVGPEFLREHFFPCLKHIGELARQRKIPFIYHSDGVLWDVMGDITDSGVTALHPVEPKSMDIKDLKEQMGSRLCLCGGVEVDVLARGSQEEVRSLTRRYLEEIAPRGGYCAGSSNSIPEYVKIDNYLAMVETVLRHRRTDM
jgi:uroporphyrinogen decarboxylase